MSILTKSIGLAKKLKHRFQDQIRARTPVYLSPVRRIEQVATRDRICAMTFDDGPCRLPANPSSTGLPLTLDILNVLERYGAKGTFDIVGDTSGNYPDQPGKPGSAAWGGIAYDHYPDFGKDDQGGAAHCPDLVRRILDGGHEITSHTWAHILYGPKPLVYGKRKPMKNLDAVTDDLHKLHDHMLKYYGCRIRLSRPPHYVDNTYDGFSAYDAYARLGYQYMAASFDGAGWLPLATYDAEVDAMSIPVEQRLAQDPDYFRGQIIFQKDGYNMARRSPVADGLAHQLELLTAQGYRIVTVSELLAQAPFLDVAPDHPRFSAAKQLLEQGWCVCFRDNTLRLDAPLTRGALAMMAWGGATTEERIALVRAKRRPARDVPHTHPYAAAIARVLADGSLPLRNGKFYPGAVVTPGEFSHFCQTRFGASPALASPITHGDAIAALASLL